ncbi:30S ribosomal subunit protein S18 [Candidatus Zixiibacteriota bacterium]|nr:30S ribosomal subunit protein S18 [candidate division Zixibacteria bacterium]
MRQNLSQEYDRRRRRVCRFCEDKINHISFHDERLLRRFVNERGKIVPRRISGNCALHQRMLTAAIKRARHIAIMPFTSEIYR